MYTSIDSKTLNNIKKSESYQKHAKPLIEHNMFVQKKKETLKQYKCLFYIKKQSSKFPKSPRLERPIPDLRF